VLAAGRGRLIGIVVLLACAACSGRVPTGTSTHPLFLPSRVTVADFTMAPISSIAGSPTLIRFRLVRLDDDGSPIYWTTHFLETPTRGGSLSATSGGPVSSGSTIELVYTPAEATTAFLTIYPASTANQKTGDGSGDWRAVTIKVAAAPVVSTTGALDGAGPTGGS
jgi:hypothetical protein